MLSSAPQVIALTPGKSSTLVLTSTLNDLTLPTFMPSAPNQVTFTQVTSGTAQQAWTVTAGVNANATVSVAVKDIASTDTTTIAVSVVPASLTTPQGYQPLDAIALVRLRANEPTLPTNLNMLILLNESLQEVERSLGQIRLTTAYPLTAGQNVQALTSDVQDVLSVSYSTGPVSAAGSIVYPLFPMGQSAFMDFAAGTPGASTGPPTAYFVTQDSSGTIILQLYPNAAQGYLNVYYRARPVLYALDATGLVNVTTTNLDSAMQQAMIVRTIATTLEARGRSGESVKYFAMYDSKIDDMKASVSKRSQPSFGSVRDVKFANSNMPPWWKH